MKTKIKQIKKEEENSMDTKFIAKIVAGVVILITCIVGICGSITTVGADEIVVKQNILDGQLQVWTTPGVHWQNFGRVTRYKKSAQYWFSVRTDEGKALDESIQVRFNDGGHGKVSGSLRYDLPLDYAKMVKLHSTYGSMETISHDLVQQVVNKSVYMTGPLMSSRESYAEKRANMIDYITDQILHGVFKTQQENIETIDLVSGQKKIIQMNKPMLGNGPNGIMREDVSAVASFGLNVYNITINQISYDPQVEEQIKQQQQATMAVQQAMVDARKAEQKAITVEKEGQAKAAEAKWNQEVEKAKAVTEAEQQVAVAKLNLEAAKLNKDRDITEAQGQAEAKKLAINADGALKLKLDAWVDVQKAYAAAMGQQRWVPDIQLGHGSGSPSDLMTLWQVQAAKQLQLNTSPSGNK